MTDTLDIEYVQLVKAFVREYEKEHLQVLGGMEYDYVLCGSALADAFTYGKVEKADVHLLGFNKKDPVEGQLELEDKLDRLGYRKTTLNESDHFFSGWSHSQNPTIFIFTTYKTRQELLNEFKIKHLKSLSYYRGTLYISSYAYDCVMNRKFSVSSVGHGKESYTNLVNKYVKNGWTLE